MSKNKLIPTIVLSVICITVTLLLSVINIFTAPKIEENQYIKTQEALKTVMPDGAPFEKIENGKGFPESITEIYKSSDGGLVFKVKTKGYKDGLVIVCGIDKDGKITGTDTISSKETYGAEDKLNELFSGKTSVDYDGVPVVSGATRTREGYGKAISDAYKAFDILKGGS